MADIEFLVINSGSMEGIAKRLEDLSPRGWSLSGVAGVNYPSSGTGLLYSAILERSIEIRNSLSHEMLEEEKQLIIKMSEKEFNEKEFKGLAHFKHSSLAGQALHLLSHISAVGLSEGNKGVEVSDLQKYLSELGYLQSEDRATPGVFDKATSNALKHYQQFYGLPETGDINEETAKLMARPRTCGVPDVLSRGLRALTNPWPKNELWYYFRNLDTSPDIDTLEETIGAFQRGYSLWHAVTPIRFRHTTENTGQKPADIVIDWGTPGCGGIACTDWPYPGNSIERAYSRFDINTLWKVNGIEEGDADIVAFAAHEVGHALGLYWERNGVYYSHSADNEALMYPRIPAGRRRLNDDDVAAARRVYG